MIILPPFFDRGKKNDVSQGWLLPSVSFCVMWDADHVAVPSSGPRRLGPSFLPHSFTSPHPAGCPFPAPSGLGGAGPVSTTDSGAAPACPLSPDGTGTRLPPQNRGGAPPGSALRKSPGAGEGSPEGQGRPSVCRGIWLPALTPRLLWRGAAARADAFLPPWSPWVPAD